MNSLKSYQTRSSTSPIKNEDKEGIENINGNAQVENVEKGSGKKDDHGSLHLHTNPEFAMSKSANGNPNDIRGENGIDTSNISPGKRVSDGHDAISSKGSPSVQNHNSSPDKGITASNKGETNVEGSESTEKSPKENNVQKSESNGLPGSPRSRNIKQDVGVKTPTTSPVKEAICTEEASLGTKSASPGSSNWCLGDLVLARVGKHPFWPCILVDDPETKDFKKIKVMGSKAEQTSYHVQFFGDNGQRSWVTLKNILPFTGRKAFENKEGISQLTAKSDKSSGPFHIKSSVKPKWDIAVDEAQRLLGKSREDRLAAFAESLSLLEKIPGITHSKKRSRVAKEQGDELELQPSVKKMKLSGNTSSVLKKGKTDLRKIPKAAKKIQGEAGTDVDSQLPTPNRRTVPKVLPLLRLGSSRKTVQFNIPKKSTVTARKITAADVVSTNKNENKIVAAQIMKSPKLFSAKKKLDSTSNKAEPLTNAVKKYNARYTAGDLGWARFGKYPYWPCVITKDPESGLFLRKNTIPTASSKFIHVQFYGDKGRRSWVASPNVKLYKGVDALMAEGDAIPSKQKEKKAYMVKRSLQKSWNRAVAEADSFKNKTREERLKYFVENFSGVKKVSKAKPVPEKTQTDITKDITPEVAEAPKDTNTASLGTKKSSLKVKEKLKIFPKPGASQTSSKKKYRRPSKKKLTAKQLAKCFDTFKQNSYDFAKKQWPHYTEEEIESILLQMWDNKNEDQRRVYLTIVLHDESD